MRLHKVEKLMGEIAAFIASVSMCDKCGRDTVARLAYTLEPSEENLKRMFCTVHRKMYERLVEKVRS